MSDVINKTKPRMGKVNNLLHWLAVLLVKIMGWRYEGEFPTTKKFVLIFAPHTSNWDAPMVVIFSLMAQIRGNWIVKHGALRGPFDPILRALGAFPVNRSKMNHMVEYMVSLFKENEDFIVGLAPEGTRKKLDHWKSGFYFIAYEAQVPIIMTYLDYKRKACGVSEPYYLTGDIDADLAHIEDFYADKAARHPERRTPVTFRNNARIEKRLQPKPAAEEVQ